MEVIDIKKMLVPNLLIYIYLHCVRSSSWCATMLATLISMTRLIQSYFYDPMHKNQSLCFMKGCTLYYILNFYEQLEWERKIGKTFAKLEVNDLECSHSFKKRNRKSKKNRKNTSLLKIEDPSLYAIWASLFFQHLSKILTEKVFSLST